MASTKLRELVATAETKIGRDGVTEEVAYAFRQYGEYALDKEQDIEFGLAQLKRAKLLIRQIIRERTNGSVWDLDKYCCETGASYKVLDEYYRCLKAEAYWLFDSYLIYLEKDRPWPEKFYLPKKKQFIKHNLIQSLQDLEENKLRFLSISLPPGTGKTTLEKFFLSWVIGRHPQAYSLFFSHSNEITDMFYRGVLDITTNDTVYTFSEIFPNCKLQATNAKGQTINFGQYKPFASLQCTSVGSKNAGKVRCGGGGYLLCDDLIGGIEEALNKALLDKVFRIYGVDAKQRKQNESVKELMIATRWSLYDPIGRLKNIYAGDPECRFIAVPDIDESTGESNFDYEFNGMSVDFFKDQALTMDDISYRCLFKNEPIEREGLLYHDDDLRRYLDLPMQEPDAILGICDVKNKGSDFMFLPCVYQYGEDYYCVDCICDDGSDYGLQYQRLANLILENNMQQCEFESNTGGDRVAYEVDKIVKEFGGRCNITTKATETNKETRIIVNSDWVKRHIIFRDKSLYMPKSDYGVMMSWLLAYSIVGKNPHDDVPDGFANFALYVTRKKATSSVEAVFNPFRGDYY